MAYDNSKVDYDVVIVGAGFAGLGALNQLRQCGLRIRVFERAESVGGTWFWNRYPGARVDVESIEYSFPIPKLQDNWSWSEKYSARDDVLRYLNFAADELDLRRDIDLGVSVEAAHFDEADQTWLVTTRNQSESPRIIRARFVILATGFLSVPNVPDIPGLDEFEGFVAHTSRWPAQGVKLKGKRVGVVGTAASGVQVIQTVASEVEELVVFQRTANWCAPLGNEPMDPAYEAWAKGRYSEIRELEIADNNHGAGHVLVGREIALPTTVSAFDVTDEEREAEFERRWNIGGLHVGRSFRDLPINEEANDYLRDFWTRKIKSVVRDPDVARKLIPPFRPGSRRTPGVTGYYEVYNRDNVQLVDLRDDPIGRVVPDGVRLQSGTTHKLDVLVLATGFDAGGGAALRMDIRGRSGLRLPEHWSDGVRTFAGLAVHGFPNMFLLGGPQTPSAVFIPPLLHNYQSDFIGRLIRLMDKDGIVTIEPTTNAETEWNDRVNAAIAPTFILGTDSWWIGANIPGKPRRPVAYLGGLPEYRRRLEQSIAGDLIDYQIVEATSGT